MSKSFQILVLYNTPLAASFAPMQESDAGVLDQVNAVCTSLERLGFRYRTIGVASLADVRNCLALAHEQVVFNLVEYLADDLQDSSRVPVLVRAFHKACTGNDTLALMLSLDKWRAKGVLKQAGIPVPEAVIVEPGCDIPKLFSGSYIVKPITTDASEGIDDRSVVESSGDALAEVIRRIQKQFNQAALVEQYVGDRELNVSLMQKGSLVEVLPLAEIDLSALGTRPRIVGYAAKWQPDSYEYQHTPRLLPAPLAEPFAETVRRTARAAWDALGCQDYARVDMRFDRDGRLWVIEVNPNPDISPDAGFPAALECSGTSYDTFIETLVENAWQRLKPQQSAALPKDEGASGEFLVRAASRQDKEAVASMLQRSGFFRNDEVAIALEVMDDALQVNSAYQSFVIVGNNQVLGWISYGLTPGTISTYDVYWVVVEPEYKAKGIGTALLLYAENDIRAAGGRLITIETSGTELYYPTRQFYLKRGYQETARIPEFYGPGDDEVIYSKVITRDS